MTISRDTIEELAQAPRRTQTDEGAVQERSVAELIEADRYARQTAISAVPWGLRIATTKPPSAVT